MFITKQMILDNSTKELRKRARECETAQELSKLSDTVGLYLSIQESEDVMRLLKEIDDGE